MFPTEILEDASMVSENRLEIEFSNGILILYSNKQWEWISNKQERTLVR